MHVQRRHTLMHTHTVYAYIQIYAHTCRHQYRHTDTHASLHSIWAQTNTLLYTCCHTQTNTHAFIALSGVWQSCHHQRPGGGGGGAVGGRGLRGGGLCYAKWWLAVAIATGEGQSQRLVGEELQADYKTLWAAVSPLLSCLHGISRSTFSLSCYELRWGGSQCSVWRTEGGWKFELSEGLVDRSVHLPPFPTEPYQPITVTELPASCGFICVWVTPGKARLTWAHQQESATPPPPPHPRSVPPVWCVDYLCSSVSSSAAATSTYILHQDVDLKAGVRDGGTCCWFELKLCFKDEICSLFFIIHS